MDAFARWLTRHPLAVVVANLAVTAVLGLYAVHIRIENSLESMLPAGDPKVAYYNTTRALFGSDDVGVIGVRADDVFAPSTLEKIARVTDALARVPGVESVLSITNVVDPFANVGLTSRLLPHIPPTPDEVEAFKRRLAATPLLGKNLIADDFRGAAITVFFKNLTDAQYLDLGVDRRIMETLALMLLVLWFSFGTLRGIFLPVLAVAMALVWTLGVIVFTGKALTFGTSVLPPLLLVVGSSYAIHVMARYYEQVGARAPPDELVVRAFARVWLPLVISALTTVIGFGSLMVNRISAIWDLGFFAVIGVVCMTVTCLTFLPAALQLMPSRLRSARSG